MTSQKTKVNTENFEIYGDKCDIKIILTSFRFCDQAYIFFSFW